MAKSPVSIPLLVKMTLLLYIPVVVLRALKYAAFASFSSGPSQSYKRILATSLSRASALTLGPVISDFQIHPSSGEAIQSYCLANKIALRSKAIPVQPYTLASAPVVSVPDVILHFLTPATDNGPSEKGLTMLYCHGGGYHTPLLGSSHIPFALRLASAARANLAILEYSLAPDVIYPGQLQQAIAALCYLLRPTNAGETDVKANDLLLVGDSAGANLVAGVLAHLKEPSPYAERLSLEGKLRGVVLISPWVGMRFDSASHEMNAKKDTIDQRGMVRARETWIPRVEVWADMLGNCSEETKNREFWRKTFSGEGRLVERALVAAGGNEIMLDDAVAFARMAGAGAKDSTTHLCLAEGESHCGAMLDFMIGLQQRGSMLMDLLDWLEEM